MRSNELHSNILLSILADYSYMDKYGLTFFLSFLFLVVSPNIHSPPLTPICTAFHEHMDNSWYCYFIDRVYKAQDKRNMFLKIRAV